VDAVTDRADELRSATAGLDVNATLQTLGGALEIPVLPAALGTFSCPA
jgi:hypothetical protein